MTNIECIHGLSTDTEPEGCATCAKASHECDYGACLNPATRLVSATTYIASYTRHDSRNACEDHWSEIAAAYRRTGIPSLRV